MDVMEGVSACGEDVSSTAPSEKSGWEFGNVTGKWKVAALLCIEKPW